MRHKYEVQPELEARLKQMRLRLESPDEDTLSVKRVPASQHCFSKPRTNLLIKRPVQGQPCFVCVDDDLRYTGTDQFLVRAFASAPTERGWRILSVGGVLRDLAGALEYAFSMLAGEEQTTPAPASTRSGVLLGSWAKELTEDSAGPHAPITLFRDEEVEQVAGCMLGWQGRLALILGEPGTGKTNLLGGIARLLRSHGRAVLAVNTGALMAGTLFESERERLLQALLTEAREASAVLAFEQGEWLLSGMPRSMAILCDALDRGVRLIATTTPDHGSRFAMAPLADRLEWVRLREMCASDSRLVLEKHRPLLCAHHRVRIDAEVEKAAVDRSLSLAGALPGKAIRLLDAAAARARLNHSESVLLIDVFMSASRMIAAGE